MEKADIAIIIGVSSLAISFLSLGWNIWSKFIHPKPKMRVSCRIREYGKYEPEPKVTFVEVSVTNLGPNEATVKYTAARLGKGTKVEKPGVQVGLIPTDLNEPDKEYPYVYDGGLPKTLGVGEGHVAYFGLHMRWFEDWDIASIGFEDTFGRYHKAPSSELAHVREYVLKYGE